MSELQFEAARLHTLRELRLLDTPPSESFDRVTRMASKLFDLPISAVSLTDEDRQWFKSRVGVEHQQIPREKAPCAEVAGTRDMLIIRDLLDDPCYRDSPLAQSGARFYAGAPLITHDGFGLGAMCVVGLSPRSVTEGERVALADLAAMVMAQIELQHAVGRVEPVSGLPNRHKLIEDLQDQARDRTGEPCALVIAEILDLTRLQELLRVLGATALDDLVRASVRLLRSVLGSEIAIYQVGPVQFGWLAGHAESANRDRQIAAHIEQLRVALAATSMPTLAKPVMGVAPFELGRITAEDALRYTFCAAQDARTSERPFSFYSEATDHDHQRRFQLISDFKVALEAEGQLSLAYQPRVSLATGACVGAEALLRWTHPVLGVISPGEFIPAIEQTDLIEVATQWVIAEALKQIASWRSEGLMLPISINVSVANLEQHDFAQRLIGRLEEAELSSCAIEVEVTESALIHDGTSVGRCLGSLRDAGIRVAIDDFGTGYSSLSYIQNVPADTIKIDRSFVRDISQTQRGAALVEAMVRMAGSLGFHVVAEGIEDEEALEFLKSIGCDDVQGYLISRPMPPADFVEWHSANPRHLTPRVVEQEQAID